MTPHLNRLDETVLMRGHKICFYGEIWLIIPKLSLLPLLIWSTDGSLVSIRCLHRKSVAPEKRSVANSKHSDQPALADLRIWLFSHERRYLLLVFS